MKNSVLLCLRDINRTQKQISDETLLINTQVTKMVNNKINAIQDSSFNNLLPHQKSVAMDQVIENYTNRVVINQFIDSLDMNNPLTEPTEIRLDRVKLENEVETSRRIGNILSHVVGNLGPEHDRLKRIREFLINRNSMLTEQHIDHVNTGLEIEKSIEENNRGSLVEDYANTSTEMPSYMDPED
jgi:hypothetical protein